MKDRYLYRAKRTDNGEWVEGYYAVARDRKVLTQHNILIADNDIGYFKWIVIDPSTICQCTGLRDKSGKLIWENDILVGYLDTEFPDDTTYITVLWHDAGFYCKENDYFEYLPLEEFRHKYFKVCGNIFDNPELFEVGE